MILKKLLSRKFILVTSVFLIIFAVQGASAWSLSDYLIWRGGW